MNLFNYKSQNTLNSLKPMDDDLKAIVICFSITFCVGLVIFIIIFVIGSLESLEITEVGLDYDSARIKIDDT